DQLHNLVVMECSIIDWGILLPLMRCLCRYLIAVKINERENSQKAVLRDPFLFRSLVMHIASSGADHSVSTSFIRLIPVTPDNFPQQLHERSVLVTIDSMTR